MSAEDIGAFRAAVYEEYRLHGRSFPWRENTESWGVLLSEVMLQQTQTDRVVPYWRRWLGLWPTPGALAAAELSEVIKEWSGLGYNRRARFLKLAAERIVADHGGEVPSAVAELRKLPGIGPYTAAAVACFAYGVPTAFIETNIRAAAIHFFFPDRTEVADKELMPILEEALDRERPKEWHWALMDYGAALKKITVNPSRRSAHHVKQSKFEGSLRQARGAVLRCLANSGPCGAEELRRRTALEDDRFAAALAALAAEGMVAERGGVYRIG